MTGTATLTPGKMMSMTTTDIDADVTPLLRDVEAAYRKRRELAKRLADQDRYIGTVVRQARKNGMSWANMAKVAQVSDVAVLKAARRKDTS